MKTGTKMFFIAMLSLASAQTAHAEFNGLTRLDKFEHIYDPNRPVYQPSAAERDLCAQSFNNLAASLGKRNAVAQKDLSGLVRIEDDKVSVYTERGVSEVAGLRCAQSPSAKLEDALEQAISELAAESMTVTSGMSQDIYHLSPPLLLKTINACGKIYGRILKMNIYANGIPLPPAGSSADTVR
jgi:hypothetical protein